MVATSPNVTAEAERLVRAAHDSGLHVKAMGGVAIWLVSPGVRLPPYARAYGDLDLVASGKEARALRSFLESQGYAPDRLFNAIHGAQRLIFTTTRGDWSIDVLFDELRMSHRVDLRDRLAGPALTLAPADLLLTKLQIWRVNEKDLGDALCLLSDHPVVDGSRDGPAVVETGIDVARIVAVLGTDWGFCHTAERNLARIAELGRDRPPAGGASDGPARAEALLKAIAEAPKTLGWRARARIGERVQWYEEPEEARR